MVESNGKRKKIPADTEAEVMFQSDRLCCVDQKRGDQIHHIDGNNSNNEFINLALLCFDCHNEASISRSLRKKLTPKTIIKYRDHHYKVIKSKRELSLARLNNSIENLTSTDLINAAMTALTLFEISKIKEEYYNCPLMDRNVIIQKFLKLPGYNNGRITFEVFTFLAKVAYETRTGIPAKMIETIYSLTTRYFPPSDILKNQKQLFEIGSLSTSISFTIVYDSMIHRRDYKIMSYGLLMLKYIYLDAKKRNSRLLIRKVKETYDELEQQLNRPERNDLGNVKLFLQFYRSDLENSELSFPRLPVAFLKKLDLELASGTS